MENVSTNSILGAIGAALMMVGDLSLSVIPPNNNDSGLFVREYYLSGVYPSWRFPLLLGADHATLDYVLSQSSGNTALCIYMIANAVWAGCQRKKESQES